MAPDYYTSLSLSLSFLLLLSSYLFIFFLSLCCAVAPTLPLFSPLRSFSVSSYSYLRNRTSVFYTFSISLNSFIASLVTSRLLCIAYNFCISTCFALSCFSAFAISALRCIRAGVLASCGSSGTSPASCSAFYSICFAFSFQKAFSLNRAEAAADPAATLSFIAYCASYYN